MDICGGDVFHIIRLGASDLTGSSTHPATVAGDATVETVSNESGLLIVNPDICVSPTRIVDACSCARRSILSERVRSLGGPCLPAVMGNVKHAFIEVRAMCC